MYNSMVKVDKLNSTRTILLEENVRYLMPIITILFYFI